MCLDFTVGREITNSSNKDKQIDYKILKNLITQSPKYYVHRVFLFLGVHFSQRRHSFSLT